MRGRKEDRGGEVVIRGEERDAYRERGGGINDSKRGKMKGRNVRNTEQLVLNH